MAYTGTMERQAQYHDLDVLSSDSDVEVGRSRPTAVRSPFPRSLKSRTALVVGLVAIVGLVCLLPGGGNVASGTANDSAALARTVNLNEEASTPATTASTTHRVADTEEGTAAHEEEPVAEATATADATHDAAQDTTAAPATTATAATTEAPTAATTEAHTDSATEATKTAATEAKATNEATAEAATDSAAAPEEKAAASTEETTTVAAKSEDAPEHADTPCVEDMVAYHPMGMPGQAMSYEDGGIDACQRRCESIEGCKHFTFFALDKACHVAGADAKAAPGTFGAQSGRTGCTASAFLRRQGFVANLAKMAAEAAQKAQADAEEAAQKAQADAEEAAQKAQAEAEAAAKTAQAGAEETAEKAQAAAEAASAEREEATSPCMQHDVAYHPMGMPGQPLSHEEGSEACLRRCTAIEGCEFITFFPADKSCHVSSADAQEAPYSAGALGGKRDRCESMTFKRL